MLSKKEWVKEKVVRWQGIKNCDTHTVEGGYLFVREDDGVTGLGTHNVSSRAEAIAYHYGLYVEAQTNTACSGRLQLVRVYNESEVEEVAVGEYQLKAAQPHVQADEAHCTANCVDDPNKVGWLFCPYCGKRLHR